MWNDRPAIFPYNPIVPNIQASELIGKTIENLGQAVQAPAAMNLAVVLSAASAALQRHCDVQLRAGDTCPVSLYIFCESDSGERKSSAERLAHKGIETFTIKEKEGFQKRSLKYNLELKRHHKVSRQLKNAYESCPPEEQDEALNLYLEHSKTKPTKPRPKLIRFEDATPQAMQKEMQGDGANALLSSSEGGKVLNSSIANATSLMNDFWNGSPTTITRKSVDSMTVVDPRLTVLIMAQSSARERFIQRTKDDVRGNGFLARFLYTKPASMCGHRISTGVEPTREWIYRFEQRVVELLEMLPSENPTRVVLQFSFEAKKVLLDVSNDIESKMREGEYFHHARDHASKLVENIARVAAILHSFDSLDEGDISVATLREAINIVAFFSSEFMREFCKPPKHIVDAEALWHWLNAKMYVMTRYVRRNHILQYGPLAVRKKDTLNAALAYLMEEGYCCQFKAGRTTVIDLMPTMPFQKEKLDSDLAKEFSHDLL